MRMRIAQSLVAGLTLVTVLLMTACASPRPVTPTPTPSMIERVERAIAAVDELRAAWQARLLELALEIKAAEKGDSPAALQTLLRTYWSYHQALEEVDELTRRLQLALVTARSREALDEVDAANALLRDAEIIVRQLLDLDPLADMAAGDDFNAEAVMALPEHTMVAAPTATPRAVAHTTPAPPATSARPSPSSRPTHTPAPTPIPTLFQDSFDAGLKSEWQPLSGNWRVVNGRLTSTGRVGGHSPFGPMGGSVSIAVGERTWRDYEVEFTVHGYSNNDFYGDNIHVYVRAESAATGMYFGLKRANCGIVMDGQSMEFSRKGITGGSAHRILVRAKGDFYEYFLNGERVCSVQDKTLAAGRIVLSITRYALGTSTYDPPAFDDFTVRAIKP